MKLRLPVFLHLTKFLFYLNVPSSKLLVLIRSCIKRVFSVSGVCFKNMTEKALGHWSFWQITNNFPEHLVQRQEHFQLYAQYVHENLRPEHHTQCIFIFWSWQHEEEFWRACCGFSPAKAIWKAHIQRVLQTSSIWEMFPDSKSLAKAMPASPFCSVAVERGFS